jgi:PAS domain S-box-containing protein
MTEPFEYAPEAIREGAEFMLYRARQHGNPSPVLVVALTAEQPSPQALQRLEHEYSLATELDPAWAAKPLALTRHEGRTILVLADPGGEPLDRVLERESLDLARLLRLAINLATALGNIHQRGLIHKDIKPENVLVDDAGRVWLTGFGIASRLPRERQAPAPPEVIAGTLAYMSPEQTGRMNRSIDTRSDLYSLGVMLYEMLTGVLPFAAADPLEWVHCHIARQPVAPADRHALPEPLSAIVMRLLAKNAEERYQTASGLEADLRRCLSEWQSHGRIDSFPLGTDDSSDRLLIPEKLYGREREVDTLLAAFDRVVAQGTAELVLVSGYSGVGKSSVVNELHKVLVPPRGLFAAGKFDQYKRDVPYATLAQAFQILVRQILVKSEAEVDHWRHALLDTLGPNGQLIVNLIPELEFVIGKQPPVAELPPQEARGRFQLVFRRFLGAFARPEHPLALFLDDLQWLDSATLELLEHLVTDPDVRHVLLIGAYRDNEVSSSHPLMRTLAAIRDAGVRAQEIVLAPLGVDDVERLIADALHCGPDAAGPLALLIHEKTGGNPFFAIQLLTSLAEEGLLRFDAGWIWDLERIRAKGYSGNVMDLMVAKLRRLPHPTQTGLQQLACVGNVAQIASLSVVFGQMENEIHAALLDAARAGLILRLEGSYAFLHDRIREAAYALIPESERAERHLGIGRELLASLTADDLAEHLFEVASQLIRGAELLIDHNEKVHVATIDLRAGRKAKASAAYALARAYFLAGMTLLDETDWSGRYELAFGLCLERAECDFLIGDFDRAEQLLQELLRRTALTVDEAAVHCLRIQLQIMKSENEQAVATGLTSLRQMDIDIPAHPTEDQVQAEHEALWHTLKGRPVESLVDLPLMTDQELQAATQVSSFLLASAFLTDFRLYCLLTCRMVRITVEYGISRDSAFAFAQFGLSLGMLFRRWGEGYRFCKLAGDLAERHGATAGRARVYGTIANVAVWTQPIATAIAFTRTCFRAAVETGDLTFACIGRYLGIADLFLRNDPLDVVWREMEGALDFTRRAKYADFADIIVTHQRFVATMQGRTAAFSTFSDAQFNEATFEAQLTGGRSPLMICLYWILKLKARFLSGDCAEALEAANSAKPLLRASAGLIAQLDYFYYTALTVSALYETASADEQQAWRELLTGYREQLREWAVNYPPTFADKHALVSAEIARLEKRDVDAQRLYEQAIHLAREHGFVQNEGVAHELAAQYCLAQGLETAGYAHLRNARNCYDRWGATGKVKQLDERYPRPREERTLASSATIDPPVGQLDVETVVKASQAISSEMALPALIEKLVRIAAENAGAERGLLILIRDGELRIEANARTSHGKIEVAVRQAAVTPSDLPQSALHYMIRTQETVLLDDASAHPMYSQDEYVRRKHSKSILCLPIVKQAKLVGALYLENNLTVGAFTPDRVTVLQLLASQAAISLENAGLYSDLQLQAELLQRLPVSAWTLKPDGTPDFVNQVWLDFSGQTLDFVRSHPEAWMTAVHPHDREAASKAFWDGVRSGKGFAVEARSLRAWDRTYRWHLIQAVVLHDEEGKVLKFVGTTTDIDDQKRAEEKLRESEYEARLTVNSIPGLVCTLNPAGQIDLANRPLLDFFGMTLEELNSWGTNGAVHPDDLPRVIAELTHSLTTGTAYDRELRYRRADGLYRWSQTRILPVRDTEGSIARWYGLITDIDDQKRAEETLRESEHQSRLIVDSIPGLIAVLSASGELERVSQPLLDYFERSLEECRQWAVDDSIHPDDRPGYLQAFERSFVAGGPFEYEALRVRRFDGVYRWFEVRGLPLRDRQGHIVRWYFLLTEIDDKKRAEDKIRQSEKEARQLLDMSPLHITELGPDGARLYTNRASLDYYGITLEEWQTADFRQVLHPQDAGFVAHDLPGKLSTGSPFEYEARLRRKDGHYRWFHYRLNPMSDEQGHITRWYAAGTDIEDLKLAGQRLQEQNVALREEIDKASMFEEIVGASAPLKKVLSRISKVAPTDSSVLITGETGTGKELVARAIHRRSRRSSYPFVSVNCAVIPRDLIASELFGHEKGAFTGAAQRRLGRFELAEKGTIFLDEVGELPAETQIALLRVLQEHEFERIGGTGSIRTDVRVIAATNRDLEAAIAAGRFRSDLFYRLNVFPVELPPLRKRSEDIPLLVTYFLNRYARKAGRHFTAVDKKSLDLLEAYAWPGNIRELQNVIERSVVVSESQTFSVDESWLSRRPSAADPDIQPSLFNRLPDQEKAAIEAALRECGGRVYGPSGAAAKLGIPRTTLETKIKSLKINKNRFRGTDLMKDS